MKKLTFFLGTWLIAATAFAGSETIIKERAKELRNQNNVRQGVAPPTAPAQPANAPAANPSQTQSPALVKLKTDLAAIPANNQPSATDKGKITQDLAAVVQSGKLSAATSAKLSEELCSAQAEKSLSAASLSRLVQEIDAVLNPNKYPQAKPDGIYADVQAIFQENGLKRTRAVAISDSLKAAAAEARNGV